MAHNVRTRCVCRKQMMETHNTALLTLLQLPVTVHMLLVVSLRSLQSMYAVAVGGLADC